MRKYKKLLVYISIAIAVCIAPVIYFLCFPSCNQLNRRSLYKNIKDLRHHQEIKLEDIADFDWTYMYIFEPFTDKEVIFDTIGFESNLIKTTVEKDNLQLVFVNDKQEVTCYINDKISNIGFHFDFNRYKICKKFSREGNDTFVVNKDDDMIHLNYSKNM